MKHKGDLVAMLLFLLMALGITRIAMSSRSSRRTFEIKKREFNLEKKSRTKVVLAEGKTRSEMEKDFIKILNENPGYHHIAEFHWTEEGMYYKRVTLHLN